MPYSIVVRTAELRDSDAIIAFNTAMALETEGRTLPPENIGPGVRSLFNQPELGFYLVAEIDGEIAGSLMISKEWSDWRNGLYWWIQSVYIPEKFRRRGVYREMYAEGQEGFHHVAVLVNDYAGERQRMADLGFDIACELRANDAEAAYVDTRAVNGGFTELHSDPPRIVAMFAQWRRAHELWRAGDPVIVERPARPPA